MILKEDNASSYAKALANVLSKHIKDDNSANAFSAWGGSFNTERLNVPDNIFNYTDSSAFANEVAANIQKINPQVFSKFKNIITHLATDYATKKMKTSHKGVGVASIRTEEVNYFPY